MGVVAKAKGKEACVDAFRQHIAEVTNCGPARGVGGRRGRRLLGPKKP